MLSSSIETFLTIVATGNLSKAANTLNLTQSTISLRLKNLETELGYILMDFHKGDKRITLTPAGESFLQVAQQIHSLLQSSSREKYGGGALRIEAIDSAQRFLLPPLYRKLCSHIPQIKISLSTHQSWQLCDLVECKELDIAFVLSPRRSPLLHTTPIHSEPYYVMRLAQPGQSNLVKTSELNPQNELLIH